MNRDTEWLPCVDGCTLICDWGSLYVRALDPRYAPQLTGTTELAPFGLREWTPYRLVADGEIADHLGVTISHGAVDKDPDGPFWAFDFQNQIGRSTVQVTLNGQPLPALAVEVLSTKFPTAASHLAFYRSLLDDLVEQNARLPFTFEAPTGHVVGESPQPPTPLFVYHFLRQHHLALGAALETVVRAPHRILHEEEAIVPVAEVHVVDAEVVDWVLAHTEEWVHAPHVAIARHLREKAPARVWQRVAEESLDTAPNRFVRHFVSDLAQWLAHPDLARVSDRLAVAKDIVEEGQRAPLFDHVGEMRRFPAESQVLLKRDGYRELLQLWRLFHLARRPFFGLLQEAIDSRDIATLYEFWCFFALADRLQSELGKAVLSLRITDIHGLRHKAEASFGEGSWRLVFNKSFRRQGDRTGSYSVELRPDFSLLYKSRPVLVFDAKFRFDAPDLVSEADTYESGIAQGNIRRVVKRADLYKMHTYRDALGARAAVALYPGNETVFYDAVTHRKGPIGLDQLLSPSGPTGVGALPFSPAG